MHPHGPERAADVGATPAPGHLLQLHVPPHRCTRINPSGRESPRLPSSVCLQLMPPQVLSTGRAASSRKRSHVAQYARSSVSSSDSMYAMRLRSRDPHRWQVAKSPWVSMIVHRTSGRAHPRHSCGAHGCSFMRPTAEVCP